MLPNSVVTRTGQMWKLVLAIVLMVYGSFAPLWPALATSWTLGTIIFCVGYAFGVWYIVCPKCRNRWFWSAALDARLYGPRFNTPDCPLSKQSLRS
ncbi:MAG: hypothetical protein R3F24_04310 [Gammaproteobacteria bacterium]